MRLLIVVPILLLVGGAVGEKPVAAPTTCRSIMQRASRQSLRLDVTDASLGRAAELTFEAVSRQVSRVAATRGGDRSLEHIDVTWIPDSVRQSLVHDSASRAEFANALATIIGSSGGFPYSYTQARAAVDLFRSWKLPPAPALLVLADPMVSMRARFFALSAMSDQLGEPELPQAAVSALCSIDARDRGMRSVVGEGGFAREGPTVLNADEGELLGAIVDVLSRVRLLDSTRVDTILKAVPAGSRIRSEIEGEGRQLTRSVSAGDCKPSSGSLSRLDSIPAYEGTKIEIERSALSLDSVSLRNFCRGTADSWCSEVETTFYKNGRVTRWVGGKGMTADTIPLAEFARLNWLAEYLGLRSVDSSYGLPGDHASGTVLVLGWSGCSAQRITEYNFYDLAPNTVWAFRAAIRAAAQAADSARFRH
jgi:hypothetical protein